MRVKKERFLFFPLITDTVILYRQSLTVNNQTSPMKESSGGRGAQCLTPGETPVSHVGVLGVHSQLWPRNPDSCKCRPWEGVTIIQAMNCLLPSWLIPETKTEHIQAVSRTQKLSTELHMIGTDRQRKRGEREIFQLLARSPTDCSHSFT